MFVQMSSQIVYGDMSGLGEDKMISADTVPTEPTIYGKSKMMAERGLQNLIDDKFQVAIMRPPLIYSEFARDNFPRLVNFAKRMPIFPKLENKQSMVMWIICASLSNSLLKIIKVEYITLNRNATLRQVKL